MSLKYLISSDQHHVERLKHRATCDLLVLLSECRAIPS